MASRQKPAPRQRRKTKQQAPPLVGLVVRRGALRRFDALTKKTTELPVVVSWDRRTGERRGLSEPKQADRRKTERRKEAPFTWQVADFVVVDPPPHKAEGKKPPVAKATTMRPVARKKKRRKAR